MVVGLMTEQDKFVRPIGTGLLLQIADCKFIVTAKHVADVARENKNIGCTGDNSRGVSLDGSWRTSHKVADIAAHQISENRLKELTSKKFARLPATSQRPNRYSILGFPQVWSKGALVPEQRGQFGELGLIAPEYKGSTSGLGNFDSSVHLLLEAHPNGLSFNGEPWQFKNENGFVLDFPRDLKGVSGSPVWTFSGEEGGTPELVGIQTGVYPEHKAIKVTRADILVAFLAEVCPELQPAINLNRAV